MSSSAVPSPLSIAPSQYWDGVDGTWSSFPLTVGQPAQNVRVLVSTNSPETMVVLPLGCTTEAFNPPSDCANSRGGLFSPNVSSTWKNQGLFGINENGIGFEANLGYTQNADYGLETLGLGYAGGNGPILGNQTVATIASVSPFYLGLFGLSTQPVNYTTVGNFSALSYFSSLRSRDMIPSLSWSYTAGAKYRLKAGQYAQLIFGGYDISRFVPNTAPFTLAGDIDRDIVVAIQTIIFSGTFESNLLSEPVYAFIESTDPNIWLPEATCQLFEEAFGLSIDNATGLYLINTTQYAQLQSTQLTFSLADSLFGGETVNIVLPFSALALQASYPFTPNDTMYFPLKVAATDTQVTLGRVFLQEAYLTVDYERGNFSISQCLWDDEATPTVIPILSPSYSRNTSNKSEPAPTPSSPSYKAIKLSPGVISGIAVAAVVVTSVILSLAYLLFQRRHHKPPLPVEQVPQDLASPQSPSPPYTSFPFSKQGRAVTNPQPRPEAELSSVREISQLPDNHPPGDYFSIRHNGESHRGTAVREAREAISRRGEASELPGTPGTAGTVELEDEWSLGRLSPMSVQETSAR